VLPFYLPEKNVTATAIPIDNIELLALALALGLEPASLLRR
jgi:hypothetical protein